MTSTCLPTASSPEGTPWMWTLAYGHHQDCTLEAATPRLGGWFADPPTLPNVLIFSAAMGAVQWQTSRMTHPVRLRRNPMT